MNVISHPRRAILLVEADPLVRRALQRQLESGGFRVVVAEDGEAALLLLPSVPLDALLAELELPRMRSAELLAHAQRHRPQAVRLLMTARLPAPAPPSLAAAVLQKPFRNADVTFAIERALQARSALS